MLLLLFLSRSCGTMDLASTVAGMFVMTACVRLFHCNVLVSVARIPSILLSLPLPQEYSISGEAETEKGTELPLACSQRPHLCVWPGAVAAALAV